MALSGDEGQLSDLLEGGAQGGPLVTAGGWITASLARTWRGHRALTLTAIAVGVLLAAGVDAWAQTHLPTRVTVSVEPATVQATQPGVPWSLDGSQMLTPLVLVVRAQRQGNARLVLRRVTGPGLSTDSPPQQVVNGSARLTTYAVVSCADWRGATGLTAGFQVTDGALTRWLQVPLDAASRTRVDIFAQRACASWIGNHPLRATGMEATLDPALPVIHTRWTVRNRTDQTWQIGPGAGAYSDGEGEGLVVPAG